MPRIFATLLLLAGCTPGSDPTPISPTQAVLDDLSASGVSYRDGAYAPAAGIHASPLGQYPGPCDWPGA